jgi:AmmeMemoRadiSam system protein B/AmmeMemoRadiSam system protein A
MGPVAEDFKPLKFSGDWYPEDAEELGRIVDGLLREARRFPLRPKLIISPHAGLRFSGKIAATAYRMIQDRRDQPSKVVLVGPSHRHHFRGIVVPSFRVFETPYGLLPVDQETVNIAGTLKGVETVNDVFFDEHCLEMQFPFLHRICKEISIVPIMVGDADANLVASMFAKIWGGEETVIILSSDLSHYHDHATARKMDLRTAAMIETLKGGLVPADACGHRVINGALKRALNLNMRLTGVDLRNSGDILNRKERVVGYGAFAFEYGHSARFPQEYRRELLRVAGQAIQMGMRTRRAPKIAIGSFPRPLEAIRGSFVTLTTGEGRLRGCIGSPLPCRPLVADVALNAFKAAFSDKRFHPLTPAELEDMDLKVAVLGPLRPMGFSNEDELIGQLKPDMEGLVIRDGQRNALFLPSVWEGIPEPAVFLKRLKVKAGMDKDHWSDGFEAFSFTTESF